MLKCQWAALIVINRMLTHRVPLWQPDHSSLVISGNKTAGDLPPASRFFLRRWKLVPTGDHD